jgi:hypothetical protein
MNRRQRLACFLGLHPRECQTFARNYNSYGTAACSRCGRQYTTWTGPDEGGY